MTYKTNLDSFRYSEGQIGSYIVTDSSNAVSALSGKIVVIGFPDDRGVVLNSGHPGARQGPRFFREQFFRLNVGESQKAIAESIVDLGDVETLAPTSLARSHELLSETVELALQNGAEKVFVIGGGHDLSFPSYEGHCKASQQSTIKVVNFDAHFDLRPCKEGLLTSGTPFYRCIENDLTSAKLQSGKGLLQIGIQASYNGKLLAEYAQLNHVPVLYYSDEAKWIDFQSDEHKDPKNFIESFMPKPESFHLSIDLDVFSGVVAAGTSAATPFAPSTDVLCEAIMAKAKCAKVVDIAELCPLRDRNDQTSRLAAGLVWRIIQAK